MRARRGGGRLAAVLLGVTLLVAGCGGNGDGGADAAAPAADGKPPAAADTVSEERDADGESAATVRIEPRDGAEGVATTGALKVTATGGTLGSVTVEDGEGNAVDGRLSADGTAWQPVRALATATRYTVEAVAEDGQGRTSARSAHFTTVVARDTLIGHFTPEDGSTVGVGMPVSLTFSHPVADREAVAAGVEVTAEPAVEIRGHWFGDRRLDFRPERYWKPGTEVTLSLRLSGVEAAEGVYGTQHKDVSFTVGRSMVSTVDAKKKTMTVRRDGEVVRTLPVTAGAPHTPTWNGTMVISEKHEVTRMNGDTVGFGGEYDIKDVPHAMRLSTSGTFIHGNYWAARGTFGSANTSHGCVGLFDRRGGGDPAADAAWFYDNSLLGDVVVVQNSQDATIAPDNGLNGWNLDWSEWGTAGP
ncbi:Ig-like domain-containing protein [Streptomyces sp. TRM 70351]|uniref:L,D-transpeptidase n=1 Tax=Streptomyces sp. TRM 70351 TaxID=3116552 RepID=UPI002E7AFB1A|nr:Ig-like domain-containing protein [Streptomyces sp. TRM 70351]MEE1927417.1 Ig-like domain-containing protein [Streptomyces sp. TRM 70351]